MPAISISFNRFLCLLLLLSPAVLASAEDLPTLTQAQMRWLGENVFASECNAQLICLTSWNEGESFPSLGIGHFIWYRQGQSEVFEETFPALLNYMRVSGIDLPPWLATQPAPDSPWQSRAQFLEQINSPRTSELRQLLASTQAVQANFIAARLPRQLPHILAAHSGARQQLIRRHFYHIANSSPPFGLYALIDYLHFKGSGANPAERYQNQGWGLLQVLENMEQPDLTGFVAAAEFVLERRVANAPPARNEQRWLAGWKNRVRGYLPPQSEPDS